MRTADKIKECSKHVSSNVVTYLVVMENGERYQVIQVMREKSYVESIYFIASGKPALIRQCVMPMGKIPEPTFAEFIEGTGVAGH